MPLTRAGVDQKLTPPSAGKLRAAAAQFHHPILKSVALDDPAGLTPDGAALMAVLLNPQLRAQRDQQSVAAAQVIAAGILPNPQISFGEDIVAGGTDTGAINAYALGLSWDVAQLLSHDAKVNAARAQAASINLTVAWQEWQVAMAAKLALWDYMALKAELAQAQDVDQRLADNARLIHQAVDRHDKTVLDLAAAEAASEDAHDVVLTELQAVRHQRLALNRAIGLPPETELLINASIGLPSTLNLPKEAELRAGLEERRLDLAALRYGYASQEETLRAAVIAQFPRINLGLNKARDNTNVKSIGVSASIDLPIFDQNQGVIAAETATRQQLYDEYVQRVFEARSDVATAVTDISSLEEQIAAMETALPSLQRLVDTYKEALGRGNVDVLSYYSALSNLSQKQLNLLKLKQSLMDTEVALEIAAGEYMPAPPRAAPATTEEAP